MENNIPKVKSLYKALTLLDYFTLPPFECGITEISKSAGLPKSTVHNIFSTFVQYGLLEYNELTHRYTLGYRSIELSNAFNRANNLVSIMRPHLEKISAATQEIVYLGKILGTDVLYLDVVYPPTSLMGGNIIGTKAPLYCTGIGKAMAAFAGTALIEQVLEQNLVRYTDNTITDKIYLQSELKEIRLNGYAVDDMEHEFGVKCVAVPLMGQNNNLVGGISVSGPSLRFPESKIKQFAGILSEAAFSVKKFL